MKLWRLMARYDAESTTYTACAGTGGTSPYTPDFSGKLVGLRGVCGGGAATALINHVQFKLNCTTFKPNVMEAAVQGNGIMTAPALTPPVLDFPVDQTITAGIPVTIEARNMTADTPVGVDVQLYGCFEIS